MDVLILVAVLLAAAVFVARPLYSPGTAAAHRPTEASEARRDALIQMLRDLEQDRRTGLIDEAEYRHQRDAAENEAAALMRVLDAGRGPEPGRESD